MSKQRVKLNWSLLVAMPPRSLQTQMQLPLLVLSSLVLSPAGQERPKRKRARTDEPHDHGDGVASVAATQPPPRLTFANPVQARPSISASSTQPDEEEWVENEFAKVSQLTSFDFLQSSSFGRPAW